MWPLKCQLVLLALLAIQNTFLILIIKYVSGSRQFQSTLGVVVVELLKIVLCVAMELPRNNYSPFSVLGNVMRDPCLVNYAFPAILYAMQNNLCLVAVARMGPVEYQVIYQSKILTTAFFSRILLNRRLNWFQWMSLGMLLFGVCSVAVPRDSIASFPNFGYHSEAVGILAISTASISSGFCGIYLEGVAKSDRQRRRSVALQSLGLCLYSLPAAIALHLFSHGIKADHFRTVGRALRDPTIVLCFAMQAASGFMVGTIIRHSDNVLKGFATSLSLVLSAAITSPHNNVLFGTFIVALAAVLFGLNDSIHNAHTLKRRIKSSGI